VNRAIGDRQTARPTSRSSTSTDPVSQKVVVTHDMIARRAYSKWQARGYPHGTALKDWLEAEAELRALATLGQMG
jgi:hypothetical protein